jgi:hypothetical protein
LRVPGVKDSRGSRKIKKTGVLKKKEKYRTSRRI